MFWTDGKALNLFIPSRAVQCTTLHMQYPKRMALHCLEYKEGQRGEKAVLQPEKVKNESAGH